MIILLSAACNRATKNTPGDHQMMMMVDNDSTNEFKRSLSKHDTTLIMAERHPNNKEDLHMMMSSDVEPDKHATERELAPDKAIKFPEEIKPQKH